MLEILPVTGIGEVAPGDDLARLIGDVIAPRPGDILVVTSKIVSKAEGRLREATTREAAIDEESVRTVARREYPGGVTRIVEHRLGLVMAAAGIDASNTREGTILLLPIDPDASAHALALALRERFGMPLGVIVSDTFGRPWRAGQTDVAIGAAGVQVIEPLGGTEDAHGRTLAVTAPAIADELAAAADLVKGKATQVPVAIVRGAERFVTDLGEPGAHRLVRSAEQDMFRLGTAEAFAEGRAAGFAEGYAAGRAAARADRGQATEQTSTDT